VSWIVLSDNLATPRNCRGDGDGHARIIVYFRQVSEGVWGWGVSEHPLEIEIIINWLGKQMQNEEEAKRKGKESGNNGHKEHFPFSLHQSLEQAMAIAAVGPHQLPSIHSFIPLS